MTKLSEKLIDDIIKEITEGRVSFQTLIDEFKISKSSTGRWSEHGRMLLEKHNGDREETLNDIYDNYSTGDRNYAIGCVRFATDIPAAFAELRGKLEKVVLAEAMQNPNMAMKVLGIWDPPQWAKRVHIDSNIEERHTITKIVIHSNDEVKQLEEPTATEAEFEEV